MRVGLSGFLFSFSVSVSVSFSATAVAAEISGEIRFSTDPAVPPPPGTFTVGSGTFFGWWRHPDTSPQPHTFEEVFGHGEFLLPDYTEPSPLLGVSLLSDWFFSHQEKFVCNNSGVEERFELTTLIPTQTGFLIRTELFVIFPDCSFHYVENDVPILTIEGVPGLVVNIASFIQHRCLPGVTGARNVTLTHNGLPVAASPSLIGTGMAAQVRVLSAGGRASLVSSQETLDPALPNEKFLPTSIARRAACFAATGIPNCATGFDDPGRPGEVAEITEKVWDARCEDGSPYAAGRITPLRGQALATPFIMKAGTGGHTHQTVDTSAIEPTPSAPQGVLRLPSSLRFDPSTASWREPTDFDGEVHITATAGEVSGVTEISVAPSPSLGLNPFIFAPGAMLEVPDPITLTVRFVPPGPGFQEIQPQPTQYNLTSRVSDPQVNPGSIEHNSNHWIDPTIQALIDGMAAAFKLDYPFVPGSGFSPELVLNVDDASLVDGGLFDTNLPYGYPHEFHRTGRELDILLRVHDLRTGTSVGFAPREILAGRLGEFVRQKHGFYESDAEPNLLHVRFP